MDISFGEPVYCHGLPGAAILLAGLRRKYKADIQLSSAYMDGSGERTAGTMLDFRMVAKSRFSEVRLRPVEVLPQIPAVFKITVVHFLSAKGFIFQQTDGAGHFPFLSVGAEGNMRQLPAGSNGYHTGAGLKGCIGAAGHGTIGQRRIGEGKGSLRFFFQRIRQRPQGAGDVVPLFLMGAFKQGIGGALSAADLFVILQFGEQRLEDMLVLRRKKRVGGDILFPGFGKGLLFPVGEIKQEFLGIHPPGVFADQQEIFHQRIISRAFLCQPALSQPFFLQEKQASVPGYLQGIAGSAVNPGIADFRFQDGQAVPHLPDFLREFIKSARFDMCLGILRCQPGIQLLQLFGRGRGGIVMGMIENERGSIFQ